MFHLWPYIRVAERHVHYLLLFLYILEAALCVHMYTAEGGIKVIVPGSFLLLLPVVIVTLHSSTHTHTHSLERELYTHRYRCVLMTQSVKDPLGGGSIPPCIHIIQHGTQYYRYTSCEETGNWLFIVGGVLLVLHASSCVFLGPPIIIIIIFLYLLWLVFRGSRCCWKRDTLFIFFPLQPAPPALPSPR